MEQTIVDQIPFLWEWSAVVGLLFIANCVQFKVITVLYKRNIALSDQQVSVTKEQTIAISEFKNAVQNLTVFVQSLRE